MVSVWATTSALSSKVLPLSCSCGQTCFLLEPSLDSMHSCLVINLKRIHKTRRRHIHILVSWFKRVSFVCIILILFSWGYINYLWSSVKIPLPNAVMCVINNGEKRIGHYVLILPLHKETLNIHELNINSLSNCVTSNPFSRIPCLIYVHYIDISSKVEW